MAGFHSSACLLLNERHVYFLGDLKGPGEETLPFDLYFDMFYFLKIHAQGTELPVERGCLLSTLGPRTKKEGQVATYRL